MEPDQKNDWQFRDELRWQIQKMSLEKERKKGWFSWRNTNKMDCRRSCSWQRRWQLGYWADGRTTGHWHDADTRITWRITGGRARAIWSGRYPVGSRAHHLCWEQPLRSQLSGQSDGLAQVTRTIPGRLARESSSVAPRILRSSSRCQGTSKHCGQKHANTRWPTRSSPNSATATDQPRVNNSATTLFVTRQFLTWRWVFFTLSFFSVIKNSLFSQLDISNSVFLSLSFIFVLFCYCFVFKSWYFVFVERLFILFKLVINNELPADGIANQRIVCLR